MLKEGREAALSLKRGTVGDNVMYFETGQGSALSADAHHGVDQQTLEARAYGVARTFKPLLVNSVVGFIGPEYLYDGKQIIRAGLEDHFCGKLMGLPMGCDVCYTNHAEADQDDMDVLLMLLGAAGVTFVMGVPGADDVMLNYQSTSFHDALYVREALGLRRAPEFEAWLARVGLADRGRQAAGRAGPGSARARRGAWRHERRMRPWPALRRFTEARIGLGRAGSALPDQGGAELRHGARAGARRRDDAHRLGADRAGTSPGSGLKTVRVDSAATDRDTYLRRPDLGRRLSARIARAPGGRGSPAAPDLLIVVADGLSSTGVAANAVDVIAALLPLVRKSGWMLGPVVLASQGRVALGDDAGEVLGARAVLVLIGERPGLSSPDSLGAYLTYAPRVGRKDGERNCVSNIRRGGLGADEAAFKIDWLLREAFRRSLTGVALKDESEYLLEGDAARAELAQAAIIRKYERVTAGSYGHPRFHTSVAALADRVMLFLWNRWEGHAAPSEHRGHRDDCPERRHLIPAPRSSANEEELLSFATSGRDQTPCLASGRFLHLLIFRNCRYSSGAAGHAGRRRSRGNTKAS